MAAAPILCHGVVKGTGGFLRVARVTLLCYSQCCTWNIHENTPRHDGSTMLRTRPGLWSDSGGDSASPRLTSDLKRETSPPISTRNATTDSTHKDTASRQSTSTVLCTLEVYPGGYSLYFTVLDTELNRLAGDDWSRRISISCTPN